MGLLAGGEWLKGRERLGEREGLGEEGGLGGGERVEGDREGEQGCGTGGVRGPSISRDDQLPRESSRLSLKVKE